MLHPLPEPEPTLRERWTGLSVAAAERVNPIVLAILYLVVVTPFAIVTRLVRRDPMRRRLEPTAKTYWEDAPPSRPPEDATHPY